MSWWKKLFRRKPAEPAYGLHPDNPVLCGGGIPAEIDYLERLRCPSGQPIHFTRQGSLKRTALTYLDRPDVALHISQGTARRLGQVEPEELPLDAYLVLCGCGDHLQQVFIDIYYRGPELPIGVPGWTLAEGSSPAESLQQTAACPYCGGELRTPQAKQCRHCKMDWHDPENIHRRQ